MSPQSNRTSKGVRLEGNDRYVTN